MGKVYKSNWKAKSKRYLLEMEKLLDKMELIKDEDTKKEILYQFLRCDNELTKLSEKLFDEEYSQGLADGRSKE